MSNASLRYLEPTRVADAYNVGSDSAIQSAHFVSGLCIRLHNDLLRLAEPGEYEATKERWEVEMNDALSESVEPDQRAQAMQLGRAYADARTLEELLMFNQKPLQETFGIEGNQIEGVQVLSHRVHKLDGLTSEHSMRGLLGKSYDQINGHINKAETIVMAQRQLLFALPEEMWVRYMLPHHMDLELFFEQLVGTRIKYQEILSSHPDRNVAHGARGMASYFSTIQAFAEQHQESLDDREMWADAVLA